MRQTQGVGAQFFYDRHVLLHLLQGNGIAQTLEVLMLCYPTKRITFAV